VKKIVFIMLLTFITTAFAEEGSKLARYSMVPDQEQGVWIFDANWSRVTHCRYEIDKEKDVIICSDWLPVTN
jgi:hypothetical protein